MPVAGATFLIAFDVFAVFFAQMAWKDTDYSYGNP